MSFILRSSRAMARVAGQTQLRQFTVSSASAIKESNDDVPDLGSKYEQHKQDQLNKQKEGKNHWKPELASQSEEAINADKSDKGIDQMKRETKERADRERKSGTTTSQGNPNN